MAPFLEFREKDPSDAWPWTVQSGVEHIFVVPYLNSRADSSAPKAKFYILAPWPHLRWLRQLEDHSSVFMVTNLPHLSDFSRRSFAVFVKIKLRGSCIRHLLLHNRPAREFYMVWAKYLAVSQCLQTVGSQNYRFELTKIWSKLFQGPISIDFQYNCKKSRKKIWTERMLTSRN